MDIESVLVFFTFFLLATLFELHIGQEELKLKRYSILNNRYGIILCLYLFVIASLRSPFTGNDTLGYYSIYKDIVINNYSIKYYLSEMITGIIKNMYQDFMMWNLTSKICSYVIKSPQVWLSINAGCFLFTIHFFIKKYSDNAILSWVYFSFIYIFTFCLQGLRQTMAMNCIILSFMSLDRKEKYPIRYLFWIALAYLFHQSSIIFLISYPLTFIKKVPKYSILIILIICLCVYLSNIFNIFIPLINATRFGVYLAEEEGLSLSGWIVLYLFYIYNYCCRLIYRNNDNDKKTEEIHCLWLNLTAIGVILQSFVCIVAEFFRLAHYFCIFNLLLLPKSCSLIKDHRKRRMHEFIILCLMTIYFFISGGFHYFFFWQDKKY